MTCEAAIDQTLQRLNTLFIEMVSALESTHGKFGSREVQSAKSEIVASRNHVNGILGVLREIASRNIPVNGIDLPNECIRFYTLTQILEILKEVRTHKFWPYMVKYFERWTDVTENAFLLRQEHVKSLMSLTRDGNGSHGPANVGVITGRENETLKQKNRTLNNQAETMKEQSQNEQQQKRMTQRSDSVPSVGYELTFTPNGTLVELPRSSSQGYTPPSGFHVNTLVARRRLLTTQRKSTSESESKWGMAAKSGQFR